VPVVVFPDRTLRALAASRPRDNSELAEIDGIGPAKLERYGLDVEDTELLGLGINLEEYDVDLDGNGNGRVSKG